MTKAEMRAWARTVSLPEASPDCVAVAVTRLAAFAAAKTVFCFASAGSEPPTRELIGLCLRLGKRVCVPRCREGRRMDAVEICSIDALVPGAYGIPEPVGGTVIPPDEIDFAVIPCVCADNEGNRLGHGAGYYDRFLTEYRGFSAVLCRRELIADAVPLDRHDIKADVTVAV